MAPWKPAFAVPLPRPPRGAYKARVHLAAWAIASTLALGPASGPAAAEREPSRATRTPTAAPAPATTRERAEGSAPGRLVLGPDHRGTLSIVDAEGREVAALSLRPGRRTVVELPPDRKSVV